VWIRSRARLYEADGRVHGAGGLAGCTKQPDEPIYTYVKAPEDLILGKPMYFATAHPFVTVRSRCCEERQFRPIKVDVTQSTRTPWLLRSVLAGNAAELYDPDRSQHVTYRGETSKLGDFVKLAAEAAASKDGTGLYFLSATITRPRCAAVEGCAALS